MQTYRRLNEGARYWGLTWQAWCATGAGGALLYLAVRFSPLPTKPTISLTLIVLAIVGCLLFAISGQSISPGAYAAFWWRWRFGPSLYLPPDADSAPVTRGVMVDAIPPELLHGPVDDVVAPVWTDDEDEDVVMAERGDSRAE